MPSSQTFLEQLNCAAASGTGFGVFAAPAARDVALNAVSKIDGVMALPEVTTKILAAVQDPDTSVSQLSALVSQDPALVTRMLTVVNSALFGHRGKINSIERAVVHLGHRGVKQLAMAAGLGQVFRGRGVEACAPKNVWMHSVAVAVAAREMAKDMGLAIAEEVFIAGLTHDLGILVAMQVFPQQLQFVCQQAKNASADFCQLERDLTGTDHQMLGEALAVRWGFPHACQVAANYHHSPMSAMFQDRLPAALVHVSDTICCKAGHGFALTAMNQVVDDSSLSGLGIDQQLVAGVSKKLPELFAAASSLFA